MIKKFSISLIVFILCFSTSNGIIGYIQTTNDQNNVITIPAKNEIIYSQAAISIPVPIKVQKKISSKKVLIRVNKI